MHALPRTHEHHKKNRVMKAEKTYSSCESSEDEFLAKSIGHLRVKTVKKSNSLSEFPQTEIGMLHKRATELGKELETAKEVIKNLVAQQENYRYNPSMQTDSYMPNFQNRSTVFSKSDKNEERKLRDLVADAENDEEMKGITKTSRYSDIEESEMESDNQDKTQRMQNHEKLMTFYKAKRRRRKGKRH